MKTGLRLATFAALCGLAAPFLSGSTLAHDSAGIEFFEKRVRPILVQHCQECHGAKLQHAGLRLDSRAGLDNGTDGDKVVVPGDPAASRLIHAVRRGGETPMPPDSPLSEEQVQALAHWVQIGAPWHDEPKDGAAPSESAGGHWSFQPVRDAAVPPVRHREWARSPIDGFVLAKLEPAGLLPAPPARRRALIRRVSYDLVGLPPTQAEVSDFESDPDPKAFEHVVDRLLASPRFGERWARYWLDIARFADTKGYVFTAERRYHFAYTYRDYVIDSLNRDLPYDQFLLEQIAADCLPNSAGTESLAALGFLTLGRRFLNNPQDIIDDRIDVVTRGLMGLTVACARCHDHKYDPIPTADYYSLYGIFASTHEPGELPVTGPAREPAQAEEYRAKVDATQAEITAFLAAKQQEMNLLEGEVEGKLDEKGKKHLAALRERLVDLGLNHPGAPRRATVLLDSPTPIEPVVFVRGNPGRHGDRVPRQFLAAIGGPERQPFSQGSGRLELAKAIANRDNPLTARVAVNWVWRHLFGTGLVPTASDFGTRGEPPTHPELLDHLACRFTENGWSLKSLIRSIILSSTYQQESFDRPECRSIDPTNRLLWRHEPRRLDFEALRDSLLQVTGELSTQIGGRSVSILDPPFTPRRTLYAFVDRQNLEGVFRAFDFANPNQSSPDRFVTTVPQQSLFLLNSAFIEEVANRVVARMEEAKIGQDHEKVAWLYRRIFSRDPTPEETSLGLTFLVNQASLAASKSPASSASPPSAWPMYAQTLLLTNEFAFVD